MTRLLLLSGSDHLGDGLGVGERSDVDEVAYGGIMLVHANGGNRMRGKRKRSPAWLRRGLAPQLS